MVKDENLEKHMGCMAGFFQIFDRHQFISSKRLQGTKRLPHSKVVDDEESSEISGSSTPAISRELVKQALVTDGSEYDKKSQLQETPPPNLPHRLSVFELKQETKSSMRFTKETPRLSLDSRAIVDSKGSIYPREIRTNASILTGNRSESSVADAARDGGDKQGRSPSVIARLMGIEQLPYCNPESENVQLRRSASESRVARDLFNNRPLDNSSTSQLLNHHNQSHSDIVVQNLKAAAIIQAKCDVTRSTKAMDLSSFRNTIEQPKTVNRGIVSSQWKSHQHRRSFFYTADAFPEPKQTMWAYPDFEKKLKMRGIDEASKDLETLKQILEALQLKGLLHSRRTPEQRNFVYDRNYQNESPIVVMKHQSSNSTDNRRLERNSWLSKANVRRNLNESLSTATVSPRRDKSPQSDRNVRSPTRTFNSPSHSDSNGRRNNNSAVKTKTLSVKTQRRRNESFDNRKISPVQSPRTRSTLEQTVTNNSPRFKRSTAENYLKEKITTVMTEDESSSISGSTISTSSQQETERSKMEELRDGKSLLERCDKLLHSISEMNANEMQPSPVSVLELSTFYKEDSFSSPSPVPKRTIDFQFQDLSGEEEWCSSLNEPYESIMEDEHNEDPDFVYIIQILRAFDQFPEDSNTYYLLEKQEYLKGNDISKGPVLKRRLIFDIITEIVESNIQLPPWKSFQWTDSLSSKPLVQKIWAEYQRIRCGIDRKVVVEEDICDVVCGVLEKDLAGYYGGVNGWKDCSIDISETVLDIERLIFKDLIGDTISELAQYRWRSPTAAAASRKKLVF